VTFRELPAYSSESTCFYDAVVYIDFHDASVASLVRLDGDNTLLPLRMGLDHSCPETRRGQERLLKGSAAVISGTGYVRADGVFIVQCVFDVKPIKLTDRQKLLMIVP
jgi:hypothetical protein